MHAIAFMEEETAAEFARRVGGKVQYVALLDRNVVTFTSDPKEAVKQYKAIAQEGWFI